MDRGCRYVQLLFLRIWLGLFPTFCINVNELTVKVQVLSPTDDVVEGDTVSLQCNATGMPSLPFGYELEWWGYNSNSRRQITRNEECIDPSCSLDTTHSLSRAMIGVLTIRNIDRDTVYYKCSVHSQRDSASLAAGGVFIWVHYFPSLSCYPDGPFTVQEGKSQYMRCSSQIGKPNVNVDIVSSSVRYNRHKRNYQYTYIRLTVRAADNGSSYDCVMNPSASRFSGAKRTCTIGPMTVVPMTTSLSATTQPTTSQHSTSWETTTASEEDTDVTSSVSSLPWIAAFLGIILLLIVSVILFVKRLHRSDSTKTVQTNPVKASSIFQSSNIQQDQDCRHVVKNNSKRSEKDVYEVAEDVQSIKKPV